MIHNNIKSYIYMGSEPTLAVLVKGGAREEIQPGQVVDSEVKLSGSFIVFDNNILEMHDHEISAQQSSVEASQEDFDMRKKEMLARHKEELKALEVERETVVGQLQERLDNFLSKREIIVENLAKATEVIDNQISALESQKAKVEEIAGKEEKPKKKK